MATATAAKERGATGGQAAAATLALAAAAEAASVSVSFLLCPSEWSGMDWIGVRQPLNSPTDGGGARWKQRQTAGQLAASPYPSIHFGSLGWS